jgi:23S rRNA (adenine2030-N6)-methyltransferase
LPTRYLHILAKINRCEISELPEKLNIYAGSPVLIKDYLRRDDSAIFNELNREDFYQLRKSFAGSERFSLFNLDGFSLLKSKLPPLEKRGLIVIDPAFEKDQNKISDDYQKIFENLEEAYKRFAHGTYLVWYPIIKTDGEILAKFYKAMTNLKFEKILHTTFDIGQKEDETKMHACGMFIFNAPWQLDEKLNFCLPQILKILKKSEAANFEVKWIKNS